MKCYFNAKIVAILMTVIRQSIINFKKVLDMVIQFQRNNLFYTWSCIHFNQSNNNRVKEINIFGHTYLYSAYAVYATFLLRDKRSIKELINTFATFWKYSGWKPNHKKCEIVGYWSAEKCESGMKCIDLSNDTIKITGIYFL